MADTRVYAALLRAGMAGQATYRASFAVERVSGVDALGLLGVQAAWAAGLLAGCVYVFGRGARRLVVQGG